jgi:hypothetical protein
MANEISINAKSRHFDTVIGMATNQGGYIMTSSVIEWLAEEPITMAEFLLMNADI